MTTVRNKGEAVRKFLINNLEEHPNDIVRVAMKKFGCSRQAVHKHLRRLIEEATVTEDGQTRSKAYRLAPLVSWEKKYELRSGLVEDQVWRDDIASLIGKLPEN